MESKSTFHTILKLTNMALLLLGLRLYDTEVFLDTKKWFYFNLVFIYTVVCAEIYWFVDGVSIGRDLSELTYIIPCVTVTLLGTAKNVSLFLDQERIIQLVDRLKKIHPEIKKDARKQLSDLEAKENGIVESSTKYLNLNIGFLLYSSVLVTVTFTTLPLVFMVYDHVVNRSNVTQFPLQCKYFFDTTVVGFGAYFAYFHQSWSIIVVALSVFGPDTLFLVSCTFLQMHFRILQLRLENVAVLQHDGTRNAGRLRKLVMLHQELIEIVDILEWLYSNSMLLNFISSSFLICVSGFNVTSTKELGTLVPFMTFLVMSCTQIALLCYCGDMVVKTSGDLSEAAYKCLWYEMDVGFKRTIFILIQRSQRPCRITAANFAVLNLTAFTTVVSRSWSYFALLKTMYN